MDMPVDRTRERAAVFIDLENMGVVGRSEHMRRKVEWLLNGLRESLRHRGMRMGRVWGAVQIRPGVYSPVAEHRSALSKLFKAHNGKISWGHNLADAQLIVEAERQLAAELLPKTIVLVSGDGDFAGLVMKLRTAGKDVIVLHPSGLPSAALVETADIVMPLRDFIGVNPPERRFT